MGPQSPARLESAVGLLRSLAYTGGTGLDTAQQQRAATVAAAERLDHPELAARVISGYDVPAIWTRSDDPARSARIVAAAEHALARLGPDAHDVDRARLLSVIAVESRFAGADEHATAVDLLVERHERPGAGVFTHWYRAMRLAAR